MKGTRVKQAAFAVVLVLLIALPAAADICYVYCPYCLGHQTADEGWETTVDHNVDTFVNLADLALLAQHFNTEGNPEYDYNCDGVVSIADLGVFAIHYNGGCR